MPKNSFISSLLVIAKKCFKIIVFTFVLLNLVNCLTLLSANVINEKYRYEWPLIDLSKQTNHKKNHFPALNANVLPKNHSLNVKSDGLGKTRTSDNFGPQYVVNSYSLVSNDPNDIKINGKYKSKAERSVTNSGVINSGSAVSVGSGPSFEEEPTDSFIVRSKSAILRCKTLNALKAWFSCNTGDERSIQDKQNGHNYVDPQTGIRIIELDLEVSKNDIEEHAKAGYTTPYQCWCNAYGGHQQIISRRASILFSFLRKHFINEPLSQTVALNSQTSFTCLPPEGDPKPTLFWLKNDEVINASSGGVSHPWDSNSDLIPENLSVDHRNYFIGHDSSLIIKEVTLADQANYTCAVRNPAGVRYSEPAQLTIFVNGGWSSWSSWSSCNAANKCGRGSQKRIRYCSNPTPVNNGQYCVGESTQTSDCSLICSPIHGSWTSWSSWSTCSHECSQVRRRVCSNPPPKHGGTFCAGHDFLIKNCTGGMCRKLDLYQLQRREREESGAADNEQQIYLMSIIITTTFLFLFVVFVFILIKRKRIKNQEWNDSDEERVGEDGQAMLLLLQQQNQQQPDLIRNGGPEKCQLISRLNDCNTNLLDHFVVRCDPLPSVPHTMSSANSDLISHNNNLMNCSQSSFNHLNASMSGTPKLKPTSAMSMATTTTTATITTSEEDNNDSEPDYAEPIILNKSPSPPPISHKTVNTPKMSRISPNHSNSRSEELTQMFELRYLIHIKVREDMSTTGYFSFSSQLGVGLYIPPNAIDFCTTDVRDPKLSIHYGIDLESRCPGVSSLSPVVIIGNYGTIDLNRPLVVCVEHCLSLRHGKVPKGLSILWQENINSPHMKSNQKWIEVLRYGEEDLNTSCFVEIDSKFIYLSTNLSGKYMFCVRKESNPKNKFKNCNHLRDESHIHDTNDTKNRISSPLIRELGLTKVLNFALSIEPFSSTEHLLKVYIYDNISSSRLNFLNESSTNGLTKIGDQNTVLKLYSNGGPLVLELLTPIEGRVKGMKRAEVPLTHLWNCGPNSPLLHCSYIIINGAVVSGNHSKFNYEIKVWQNSNNGSDRCYDNSILINYSEDSNENNYNNNFDKKQVTDQVIKLYGDSDIDIRLSIAAHLDLPRNDQNDWRQLASICGLDHYLPYFASQQSPTTNLLDLLEATLLNDLKDNELNESDIQCSDAKQSLNRRLIEILERMEREELIPLVWRQIDN